MRQKICKIFQIVSILLFVFEPKASAKLACIISTPEQYIAAQAECKKKTGPYNPVFANCTLFCENFQRVCDASNLFCRSVDIGCTSGGGHAVNIIKIGEQYCFYQSEDGKVFLPCFSDQNNPSQQAICAAMGKPFPCDCQVRVNSPVVIPNNCTVGNVIDNGINQKVITDRTTCFAWCNGFANPDACVKDLALWKAQCVAACKVRFP